MILLYYFEEIRKEGDEFSYYKVVGLIGLAAICTLGREMMKEWGIDYVGSVWGGTNRLLRGLFYSKLATVNSSFLSAADFSIIRKVETYEFESIINFACLYPKIYNFPILAIVSLGIMTYFINYFTAIAIGIFIMLATLLYCLILKISKENLAYEYAACQRALVIDEIMAKMGYIKND